MTTTTTVNPMTTLLAFLRQADPTAAAAITREGLRQEGNLCMIASENYASLAVLLAGGTVPTNKYAEGYPGKRYYGGCEAVDAIEVLAQARARELFGAEYVNVQPHSGSSANAAVYLALLNPGDAILGLPLPQGGHLTHGAAVSSSGMFYKALSYGVDPKTGLIDMNRVEDEARKGSPKIIIAGASAYSRDYDYAGFRDIAHQNGALLMVDMAHPAGLIAAGALSSPLLYADIVTTTTHKTLRGPRGGMILVGKDRPDPRGRTIGQGEKKRVITLGEAIDKAVMPGLQGGPLMHVIGAKAIAFGEALQAGFRTYANQVIDNAHALADAMMNSGFHVVSGGTDNHLLLVDLRTKFPDMTGKEAERLLGTVGITANANMVPGDTRTAFTTSGIRLGTAALTTRGMIESDLVTIAGWINTVLSHSTDQDKIEGIRAQVAELTANHPIYP